MSEDSRVLMKMKKFNVLWVWMFLSAEFRASNGIEIYGSSGKHVIISCSHSWASTNIKYFCRDPCGNGDILVKSDWLPEGRYRLEDLGKGTFTVNITDLQESDSGIYWCGVERVGQDTYKKVTLNVSKDRSESTTTSTEPHTVIQTSTDSHTTTPAAHSEAPSTTASPDDALTLSPSVTASSHVTVYVQYAVGGSVGAVIVFIVGLVAVHQYRKKVKTSASSVTPVNKHNESRDEHENCVYDNDLRDTDKSTKMKPLDKTEVPKREEYSVYENAHFNMGQPEELYGNL